MRSDSTLTWMTAKSFSEFGELVVKWLRGELPDNPWDGGGPFEETSELAEDLVALNQRGFVTTYSQPGEPTQNGCGQRAAVDGVTTEELARKIETLGLSTDLLVFVYGPEDEVGFHEVPITTSEFRPFTWSRGLADEMTEVSSQYSAEGILALKGGWRVYVIDPKWGRKRYLWNKLRQATGPRFRTKWNPISEEDEVFLAK